MSLGGHKRNKAVFLEMEYRLIALIEEEVENTHVGQEAMLLLIHLVISLRNKFRVRERLLRTNRITKICDGITHYTTQAIEFFTLRSSFFT